jgi:hypothetical protein
MQPQQRGVFMPKLVVAAYVTRALMPMAFARAPTDHVKIDITRAELQTIGQGVMKLPMRQPPPC